ncbi:MAG: ferritin-like domain-containing protein [Chloroflexota bacterium]|nr:ferritin-like domain-containing protein [Chloroflexota bacterium]
MSNMILPEDEGNAPKGLSRRKFLMGSGAAVGAAALFGATSLTPGQLLGVKIASAAGLNSDMDILMFALTLEHVEDAAYRAVNASGLLSGQVADLFKMFGDHEHQHVVALTDVITKLGGTPVAEQASYSFPNLTSQDEVVKFFATVEEVGAGAYLGAAPLLKDKALLSAAASIHDVEAQHASVLRAVMNDPAPSPAFGTPKTYDEVIAAVGPLLAMNGGNMPGMPTTGAPSLGTPWLLAGLGAVAAGAMIKVRQRQHSGSEEEVNTEA